MTTSRRRQHPGRSACCFTPSYLKYVCTCSKYIAACRMCCALWLCLPNCDCLLAAAASRYLYSASTIKKYIEGDGMSVADADSAMNTAALVAALILMIPCTHAACMQRVVASRCSVPLSWIIVLREGIALYPPPYISI